MKQEQVDVARAFLEGKDVFAVHYQLGSERACAICMPITAALYLEESFKIRLFCCIVVITPLIAITDRSGKMFRILYRCAY